MTSKQKIGRWLGIGNYVREDASWRDMLVYALLRGASKILGGP